MHMSVNREGEVGSRTRRRIESLRERSSRELSPEKNLILSVQRKDGGDYGLRAMQFVESNIEKFVKLDFVEFAEGKFVAMLDDRLKIEAGDTDPAFHGLHVAEVWVFGENSEQEVQEGEWVIWSPQDKESDRCRAVVNDEYFRENYVAVYAIPEFGKEPEKIEYV